MTLKGRVKNGMIVPDQPVMLPDGAEVRIEFDGPVMQEGDPDNRDTPLAQKLLKYAGKATDLPPDAAAQHDHYLYGVDRK